MNKILLLCEGKNEKAILDILLDENMLIFKREDLIELEVFPIPYNISHPRIVTAIKTYAEVVDVIRVKDPQQDKIKIKKDIACYIDSKKVVDYVTHPSIEILLILSENLEKAYERASMKGINAKSFAKSHIIYNKKRYDGSSEFYRNYFGGASNVKKLVNALEKYKQYKKNKKDEKYLFDLLIK